MREGGIIANALTFSVASSAREKGNQQQQQALTMLWGIFAGGTVRAGIGSALQDARNWHGCQCDQPQCGHLAMKAGSDDP